MKLRAQRSSVPFSSSNKSSLFLELEALEAVQRVLDAAFPLAPRGPGDPGPLLDQEPARDAAREDLLELAGAVDYRVRTAGYQLDHSPDLLADAELAELWQDIAGRVQALAERFKPAGEDGDQ